MTINLTESFKDKKTFSSVSIYSLLNQQYRSVGLFMFPDIFFSLYMILFESSSMGSLDESRKSIWAERGDTPATTILTFPVTFRTLPFRIEAVDAQTSVFLPLGWQGTAFHPAKASVREPRRRYFWKCMVTACVVWRGTGYTTSEARIRRQICLRI